MTARTGTILLLQGTTTPRYDVFTLVSMIPQYWYYDDTAVTAPNFIPGIQYTIASAGTTDFTLIGSPDNTVGTTFTCTGTPAYGYMGIGSGTGTATIAGGTRMGQPLPAAGQVSFTYLPTTVSFGGEPQTQGSPNVTTSFLVEVLYLFGTGPTLTQTMEQFRVLARDAVNAAYGLALT